MSRQSIVKDLYRQLYRQTKQYGIVSRRCNRNVEGELHDIARALIHGQPIQRPKGVEGSDTMTEDVALSLFKNIFRACAAPQVTNSETSKKALLALGFKSLNFLSTRTKSMQVMPQSSIAQATTDGVTVFATTDCLGPRACLKLPNGRKGIFPSSSLPVEADPVKLKYHHELQLGVRNDTDERLLFIGGYLLTKDAYLEKEDDFSATSISTKGMERRSRVLEPAEMCNNFLPTHHFVETSSGLVEGALRFIRQDSGQRIEAKIPPVLLAHNSQKKKVSIGDSSNSDNSPLPRLDSDVATSSRSSNSSPTSPSDDTPGNSSAKH